MDLYLLKIVYSAKCCADNARLEENQQEGLPFIIAYLDLNYCVFLTFLLLYRGLLSICLYLCAIYPCCNFARSDLTVID